MKVNYKKDFETTFNKLAFKYGHFQVFENFLDCAINGFCFNYQPDTMEQIRKRYSQQERYIFGELIQLWIYICNQEIQTDNCWFDFFGHFYEENAISKKNGFAQFFTPAHICDFMVQILDPTKIETIAEPTCGSGRFNLAVHAYNNRLFHHANDLDFTCVKMTALNFMLHGVKGVVTCENALATPGNTFKCAFIVNEGDVPNIHYTDNFIEAYSYLKLKMRKERAIFDDILEIEQPNLEIIPTFEQNISKNGQISLF